MHFHLAGTFEALVLHAYAFVPVPARAPLLARAASLHAPAYVDWCARHLPREASEPLAEVATLLGQLAGKDAAFVHLQALAREPWEVPAFLEQVAAEETDLGLFEGLFRTSVALVADAFAESYPDVVRLAAAPGLARAEESLRDAAQVVRALAHAEIHAVASLGPRGRLFGERSMSLGIPVPWSDQAATDTALLAVHELAVDAATAVLGHHRWAEVERLAVDGARAALEGTAFAPHNEARLGRMNLDDLRAPALAPTAAQVAEVATRLRA